LDVGSIVAGGETGRVTGSAYRVAQIVITMGVKLATSIISGEVDRCLVKEADNLDVSWGPHELTAIKQKLRKKGRSAAYLNR
jgi:hypothetical protein